jgi:hypothetical protein
MTFGSFQNLVTQKEFRSYDIIVINKGVRY